MYTFDDWEKAAKASGYYNEFSDADRKLARQNPDAGMSILSSKKDWHAATTDDQRALANTEAEKTRRMNGGYTGGAGGYGFNLSESPSGYTTGNWSDPYADEKKNLLAAAQTSYTGYNADTDPTAQAYHKSYVREGQRATQDALGTAAQATGGMPSSYATTAAAQAGQYYASKEADKTAELEDNAYNRYMKEKNADLQILSALETLSSNDRSNYNTDRNFGYGQYTDELNYQKNAEDTAQTRADTQKANNLAELKERANMMAKVGDFSLFKQLGYTDAEIAALKAEYDKEQAEAINGSTGRSGGRSSGGKSSGRKSSGSKKYYSSKNAVTSASDTSAPGGGSWANFDVNAYDRQLGTAKDVAAAISNGMSTSEIIKEARAAAASARTTNEKKYWASVEDAALRSGQMRR